VSSVYPIAAPAAAAMLAVEERQARDTRLNRPAEDAALPDPAAADQRVEG
jgi:hypothetical protein